MTLEEIADALDAFVLELARMVPPQTSTQDPRATLDQCTRAYILGIASGAIMREATRIRQYHVEDVKEATS